MAPTARPASANVRVSLDELVALQHVASGFSVFGAQAVTSVLAGRQASRLRGRGLSFEELRNYAPGDDIRHIDWKVTARTGRPHTRVFTEERERPVFLLVDQRLGMFFGSRVQMKSVTAAELCALLAWQAVEAGDRLGALVLADGDMSEFTPHRSRRAVLRVLDAVARHNQALAVDAGVAPDAAQFNRALERVARRATHDWTVVVISDFHGADDAARESIRRIARHNDVIAVLVHDPISGAIPARRRLVAGDTRLQLRLDLADPRVRASVVRVFDARTERLARLKDELGVPFVAIDTGGDTAGQLRRALGARPPRR
jgi:uncharacterized protein (DUF58 family)